MSKYAPAASTSFRTIHGDWTLRRRLNLPSPTGNIKGIDLLVQLCKQAGCFEDVILAWFPNEDTHVGKEQDQILAHAICNALLVFGTHLIIFGGCASNWNLPPSYDEYCSGVVAVFQERRIPYLSGKEAE